MEHKSGSSQRSRRHRRWRPPIATSPAPLPRAQALEALPVERAGKPGRLWTLWSLGLTCPPMSIFQPLLEGTAAVCEKQLGCWCSWGFMAYHLKAEAKHGRHAGVLGSMGMLRFEARAQIPTCPKQGPVLSLFWGLALVLAHLGILLPGGGMANNGGWNACTIRKGIRSSIQTSKNR